MNKERRPERAVKGFFIILAVITAGYLVRRLYINKKAADLYKSLDINMNYQLPETILSEQEFAETLTDLAVWKVQVRDKLNDGCGFSEGAYENLRYTRQKKRSAYEKQLLNIWVKRRTELDTKTEEYISNVFERGCFYVGKWVKQNNVKKAFADSSILEHIGELRTFQDLMLWVKAENEVTWIPMDLAYSMDPEGILAECEEALELYISDDKHSYYSWWVSEAEEFSARYKVKPESLEEAQKTRKAREAAEAIKLKADDKQKSSKSSAKKRRYSSSTSGSYDTIDPDDYDMEAYFEDHRDEYDDIDDAYEGFLDDEDAWDDY